MVVHLERDVVHCLICIAYIQIDEWADREHTHTLGKSTRKTKININTKS